VLPEIQVPSAHRDDGLSARTVRAIPRHAQTADGEIRGLEGVVRDGEGSSRYYRI
jgi:hypothetical protein